jgi:hypothetical protein
MHNRFKLHKFGVSFGAIWSIGSRDIVNASMLTFNHVLWVSFGV